MSIGLRTNIAAVNAIRRLDLAGRDLSSTFNRLSSGLRIVNPSDDAAGLSIGTSLKSDARVYAQGIRNVNDGLSVLNTAEGALSQLSSIMIRQKELAAQAANGVYSPRQRVALQAESNALTKEFNRIIRVTSFGNNQIIDGREDSVTVQQGYGINESTLLSIGQALGGAAGDGTVQAQVTINNASFNVDHIASGDVNGDGTQDVVYATNTGTFLVNIGNGNGTFRAPVSYVSTVASATNLFLADVNNDGNLDMISGGSGLKVLLGNGDGSFSLGMTYGGIGIGTHLEIGDFTGDGIADVVYSLGTSSGIFVGNGNGSFRAQLTFASPIIVTSNASGDFNGDGIADFVNTGAGAATSRVYLSNGNGTFSLGTISTGGLFHAFTLDVNGDGILDIGGMNMSAGLEIFLGNGDGTFLARSIYTDTGGVGVAAPYLGDMNGDGVTDVALFDGGGNMSVMFGNANGSFSNGIIQIDTVIGQDIALSDINGDGALDVVSASAVFNFEIALGNQDSSGRRNNFVSALNLLTPYEARDALVTTTKVLNRINSELGRIGAMQSRLTSSIQNIQNRRTNYEAAASQIMDVDVAEEASRLTSRRILQQAATAVLGQANQQPELALTLLGNLGRSR